MRAEALSYLCATKQIHVFGLATAITFLDGVGEQARAGLKRLVVFQRAKEVRDGREVDRFWELVAQVEKLEEFVWMGVGEEEHEEERGGEGERVGKVFRRQVERLKERGAKVEICKGFVGARMQG